MEEDEPENQWITVREIYAKAKAYWRLHGIFFRPSPPDHTARPLCADGTSTVL